MERKTYLSGVYGWLAFMVLGLMVLGPVSGFLKVSSEFHIADMLYPQLVDNSRWQNYQHASWSIFAAMAAISVAAGYRLWKVHVPSSVWFAIVALWLIGPIDDILYTVSANVIFGNLAQGVVGQTFGAVVASSIFAAIWTTYLLSSHRVKNTYSTWRTPKPVSSPITASDRVPASIRTGWWRSRSKVFRVWAFASVMWAIGVVCYVIAFEPYGYRMDSDDYFNLFFVMLAPPVLVGASKYAYDRWVR